MYSLQHLMCSFLRLKPLYLLKKPDQMKVISLFLFFNLFTMNFVFAVDIDNLFFAAMLGKTARVKSILADGIDVNGKTGSGRTALMGASFNGNIRVAKILLTYGANVNLTDNLGTTALMDAVVFGREKLIKLLITAGADVNATDNQNVSVIDKAKKTQYKNIVKILEKVAKSIKQKSDSKTTDPVAAEKPTTEPETDK